MIVVFNLKKILKKIFNSLEKLYLQLNQM